MDYEEKYKDLVKRLNKAREEKGVYTFNSVLDVVAPELKIDESEDERIRKEIIDFLELPHPQFVGKRDHEKWIAWLEKQSEQNPTNKVEPKFKVGDWVVYTGYLLKDSGKEIYVMQVASVEDDRYNFTDTSTLCFDSEKDMRSWTIQDAKDGDVLEFGDHGRLVTGILSFVNKTTGKVDVSCLLEGDKFKVGVFYNLDTVKPHPATKEQRDLLFKKMKEAGYEWDAKNKELKKSEDEPTWSVEDETMLRKAIITIDNVRMDTNFQEYYQGICDWLESLKDRVQPQPKQEWSKEDEDILNTIINHFKIDIECTDEDDMVRWLKSIKDRVQPKQEWSEEDGDIRDNIIRDLKRLSGDMVSPNQTYQKEIQWLKFLKDRYTWKPSELQMEALESATENCAYSEYQDCLRELIEQLKKTKKGIVMNIIEIFGRKLTIVEDNTNTCKKCALADICPFELMPCKDAKGNVNRRFEQAKE